MKADKKYSPLEEFEYLGYLSRSAELFFGDKLFSENREGCAVVGHFVRLQDGTTVMPSKGNKFKKYKDGSITLNQ